MTDNVEIRRFDQSDERDAIELLVAKLPPQRRAGAFEQRAVRWKWQYYANPNNPDGQPVIWVATLNGRFVGMLALHSVKVNTPMGIRRGNWCVDYVVRDDLRGRGIGKQLVQAWMNTPGIALGRGWSTVALRVVMKLGFTLVWGMPLVRFILSRSGTIKVLIKQGSKRELIDLLKVVFKPKRLPGAIGDARVSKTIPEGWDELWSRVKAKHRFTVERDADYLNWRFLSHPFYKYDFVALKSNRLDGVAIVRMTDEEPPVGIISDFICEPDDHATAYSLLREVLGFLNSKGACGAIADIPVAIGQACLSRFPCAIVRDSGIVVYTEETALADHGVGEPSAWYLGRSDSDLDF